MNDEGVENRLCRWTQMGERNLERAHHWLEEDDFLECAFQCQQAVEKFLKALVAHRTRVAPPRTHDLEKLGAQLNVPETLMAHAQLLSLDYAPTRYPDAEPTSPIPYDRDGCQRRLEVATAIIDWVRQRLGEEE